MDIQFEILCLLSEHGEFMPYVDLLNAMPSGGVYTKAQLVEMRRAGLVSGSLRAGSTVRLEAPGRALLLKLLEDSRAADAQRKEQQAKDAAANAERRKELAETLSREESHHVNSNNAAVKAAVIAALVSLFGGFLLNHVSEIVGFVSSLFR